MARLQRVNAVEVPVRQAAPAERRHSGRSRADARRDRVLAAAGTEVLCFYVSLPIGAGNTLQGATTTTTFTFDAEQTANNP